MLVYPCLRFTDFVCHHVLQQYFAKPLPALAAPDATADAAAPSGGGLSIPEEGEQPEGDGLPQAAADALLQCVAAEAPALLPPLLFLHCLTQVSRSTKEFSYKTWKALGGCSCTFVEMHVAGAIAHSKITPAVWQ